MLLNIRESDYWIEDNIMKRIFINGAYPGELRIAIVNGKELFDTYIGSAEATTRVDNIYKGIISKVEHSLEACFVNYGQNKQGFLPFKHISDELLPGQGQRPEAEDSKPGSELHEGMELIVQVEKDERGEGGFQKKGATLTSTITLLGNYFILRPNNKKSGGISKTIEATWRTDLKETLKQLELPPQHGLIARTQSAGKTADELQRELDFLVRLWNLIEQASQSDKAPFLIYKQNDLITQTLHNHLGRDIEEVIVDDEEIYERVVRYVSQFPPEKKVTIKHHKAKIPIFSKYKVEEQVNRVFDRKITLPSGGSLIFDTTEALLSIDVNSGKATKGVDMEETALQTNLEAASMIATQLRLRDHGGLIVADFIDMGTEASKSKVVNELKTNLRLDRAKTLVGNISEFGLLEMSRQRLRTSLAETRYQPCDKCRGIGLTSKPESLTIDVFRHIEDMVFTSRFKIKEILCRVPTDIAIYLVNEMSSELDRLRLKCGCKIVIIPVDHLSKYEISVKTLDQEEGADSIDLMSFQLPRDSRMSDTQINRLLKHKEPETAAISAEQVSLVSSPKPGVRSDQTKRKSGVKRFLSGLISSFKSAETQQSAPKRQKRSDKSPQKSSQGSQKQAGRPKQKPQAKRNRGQSGKPQHPKPVSRTTANEANSKTKQTGQGRKKQQSGGKHDSSGANTPANRAATVDTEAKPNKANSKNSPRSQHASSTKPKPAPKSGSSRNQPPRKKNASQKPKQAEIHTGVVVSADNIPDDIPDDIGNRL